MQQHDVEPAEEFSLGLDRTDDYQRTVAAVIARDRAATENKIAMILIGALVASLPAYFVAIWICPAEHSGQLQDALDKWFTVIGPLAGAAVGIGIGSKKRND